MNDVDTTGNRDVGRVLQIPVHECGGITLGQTTDKDAADGVDGDGHLCGTVLVGREVHNLDIGLQSAALVGGESVVRVGHDVDLFTVSTSTSAAA